MPACRLLRFNALLLAGALGACGGAASGVTGGSDSGGADATGVSDMSDSGLPSADAGDASAARACTPAGDRAVGAMPIPLGGYSKCTGSAFHLSKTEPQSAGGEATGTLALAESNGLLTVTLGAGLFAIEPGTLTLQPASDATAVVTAGQAITLTEVNCSAAVTTAGAVSIDGNEIQLALVGQGCGDLVEALVECRLPSAPSPSGMLQGPSLCENTDAGSVPFAGGTYSRCESFVGGTGALSSVTVSQSDGVWSATLSGAGGVSTPGPRLALAANNGNTALVAAGQPVFIQEFGWSEDCSVPQPNDAGRTILPGLMTRTLTTANSSLVVVGATLFVFLGGTDECGAAVSQSFSCTAQ